MSPNPLRTLPLLGLWLLIGCTGETPQPAPKPEPRVDPAPATPDNSGSGTAEPGGASSESGRAAASGDSALGTKAGGSTSGSDAGAGASGAATGGAAKGTADASGGGSAATTERTGGNRTSAAGSAGAAANGGSTGNRATGTTTGGSSTDTTNRTGGNRTAPAGDTTSKSTPSTGSGSTTTTGDGRTGGNRTSSTGTKTDAGATADAKTGGGSTTSAGGSSSSAGGSSSSGSSSGGTSSSGSATADAKATTGGAKTGTGATAGGGSATAGGGSATADNATDRTGGNRTAASGAAAGSPTSSATSGTTTKATTGTTAAGGATNKAAVATGSAGSKAPANMALDMPATDVSDWTAPGIQRFSGDAWASLREERISTVMNEPGPGTDPSCYPKDMLPLAEKGKLTKDQVGCIQKSLSQAKYAADQARLSLVLIENAHARMETDNWEWLVARHLESIDEENPGLSYRYALHLYQKGPDHYREALRWANVSLGQRAAWTGNTYHERVTRLYKLRASLAQALWRRAEEGWAKEQSEANRDAVLNWREQTRLMALEWYRYAKETEMDTAVAYNLCDIASIQSGCEGVDGPG